MNTAKSKTVSKKSSMSKKRASKTDTTLLQLRKVNRIPFNYAISLIPCCANCRWCEETGKYFNRKAYCVIDLENNDKPMQDNCKHVCKWWELSLKHNREIAKSMVVVFRHKNSKSKSKKGGLIVL